MAGISSTTSSTSYNRITGLATGLDTDSMVKQMMQPYKLKVDKAKQERDLVAFKQEMYRDIMKDLRGIFSKYTDIAKSDSLLSSKNYSTSKFTSTNESSVTAEGLSGAVLGKYKVEVQKVAAPAKLEIEDFSQLAGEKININISGKSVDIDLTSVSSTDKDAIIQKLNDSMNKAGVAGKFSKSDLANKIILQSTKTGSDQTIKITSFSDKTAAYTNTTYDNIKGQKLNFVVNGKSIDVDLSDVNDVLTEEEKKQVSLEKLRTSLISSGVTVEVDANDSNNFIFKTSAVGDGNKIELKIEDGTVLPNTQGVTIGENNIYIPDEISNKTGTDALVKVTDSYGHTTQVSDGNGGYVDGFATYKSNEFVIDNVKFTVNDVTTSSVSITGQSDTTGLVNKIKDFVKDYNEVIEKITTKLNEKKNYNYAPLTDEQKADMTDEQIEKWNAKVKQGLLKRDNDLTKIATDLRASFYSTVKGTSLNIRNLGIDFTNDMDKSGQLVIDEDKLSKALSENSEDVIKLFTQAAPSDVTDKNEIYNNSGIFQRIKTILNNTVMTSGSSFMQKVGYEGNSTFVKNALTDDLLRRERQISDMEKSLKTRENNLYLKFANLEKAMNNYNSQSAYLASSFGG